MYDKHLINQLLDFYDLLLTAKQQEIMTYYFRQDLSLAEISENLEVSRAAVSDIIKRAAALITDYENKLQLLAKHQKRMALAEKDIKLAEKLIEIEEGEEYDKSDRS